MCEEVSSLQRGLYRPYKCAAQHGLAISWREDNLRFSRSTVIELRSFVTFSWMQRTFVQLLIVLLMNYCALRSIGAGDANVAFIRRERGSALAHEYDWYMFCKYQRIIDGSGVTLPISFLSLV